MSDSVNYLIAQYVRDPMRRETRNVGVVVLGGDAPAAQFIGEKEGNGEIDGRSARWIVAHTNVYRKWVKYWREQLRKGGDDLADRLTSTNGDNYNIVRGGAITDYGNDPPKAMCEYLFSRLVLPEEPSASAEADIPVSHAYISRLPT